MYFNSCPSLHPHVLRAPLFKMTHHTDSTAAAPAVVAAALVAVPKTTRAVYAPKNGPCAEVLQVGDVDLPAFTEDKVLIRLVGASVNPSDTLAVVGTYPSPMHRTTVAGTEADLALIPGFEGVAEVVAVGAAAGKVTHPHLASPSDASPYLAPGDWVIPRGGFGTWRREAVVEPKDLIRVVPAAHRSDRAKADRQLSVAAAATLNVNPPTAYRMVSDNGLQPGDFLVQNGANSAVGQYAIQIAKLRGFRTINVIRDRPEFDALAAKLTALGADYVVRDGTDELKDLVAAHPEWNIKLALNTVGGASAGALIGALSNGGTLVSYGAMTPAPITVPATAFIFKDVTLRGFWMSKWQKTASPEASRAMLDDLVRWFEEGTLQAADAVEVPLHDAPDAEADAEVVEAISASGGSFLGKKVLLTFP
ncbi:hypothetical protein H9P43_000915 [Blastocladiella emersonii ATCC 22665]|nr:hypothetical protein H9P43_000915 [Blastocladiella emersonii ATCC 22665]